MFSNDHPRKHQPSIFTYELSVKNRRSLAEDFHFTFTNASRSDFLMKNRL